MTQFQNRNGGELNMVTRTKVELSIVLSLLLVGVTIVSTAAAG